eukprot:scaffold47582_cov50-Phaeocystis_antarctica.AAC.1
MTCRTNLSFRVLPPGAVGGIMLTVRGVPGKASLPTGVRASCANDSPTARAPACHIWSSCLSALRCSSCEPACRRPSFRPSSTRSSRQGHELPPVLGLPIGLPRQGLLPSDSPGAW